MPLPKNTATAKKILGLLSCCGAAFKTSCAMGVMSRVPMLLASFMSKKMHNAFFHTRVMSISVVTMIIRG